MHLPLTFPRLKIDRLPGAVQRLLAALGFLTRFPLAVEATPEVLARSLGYFPAAGFILGCLALLPVWLGLWAAHPSVQGALYVLLLVWSTRGLHWDGLADVCDAAGSGACGERFYTILKDSRLGAFGALGLVLGLVLMTSSAVACLTAADWLPLLLAPTVGRCLPALLLWQGPAREGQGLGRMLLPGATGMQAALQLALAVVCLLLLGPARALAGAVLIVVGAGALVRLARREAGLNGDFLGAGIILGELGVLLAGCLF